MFQSKVMLPISNDWKLHTDYKHPLNRRAVLALIYALSLFGSTHAARHSFMKHNWQAAFFVERVDKPLNSVKRGPPGELDEKIPLVVTNKCDSTIWPGVATQSGTGPGIGGFELAANKSRKL